MRTPAPIANPFFLSSKPACALFWALLSVCLLAVPRAQAQVAEQVADLLGGAAQESFGSDPGDFHLLGNRAVFFTREEGRPGELWVTEGTPETTEFLVPASGPALEQVGGILYYLHDNADGLEVRDLWRTDGTLAGTFPLAKAVGGGGVSLPDFGVLGDLFVFDSRDFGLWISDGTPAGTQSLLQLPFIEGFLPFQGELVVVRHFSIWATDGTIGGTREIVADYDAIRGGPVVSGSRLYYTTTEPGGDGAGFRDRLWVLDSLSGEPRQLPQPAGLQILPFYLQADDDGSVIFIGSTSAHGEELWTADGSGAPPRRRTDLENPSPFILSELDKIWTEGESIFFVGADEPNRASLWRVDAAPASQTRLFPTCTDDACFLEPSLTRRLAKAFYVHGSPDLNLAGPQDFVVGFEAGGPVIPVRELCAPYCRHPSGTPAFADGRVLFLGELQGNPRHRQLFQSDGTLAGTKRLSVANLRFEPRVSEPVALGTAGWPEEGWLLGLNGLGRGLEPWIYQEGQGSPRLLRDVARRAPTPALDDLVAVDGALAFTAEILRLGPFGIREAYRLSQEGEALPLSDLGQRAENERLEGAGDLLFLINTSEVPGYQLRALGAAPEESTLLASLDAEPSPFVSLDGRAYFTVGLGADAGLWESDGTEAGTRRVEDFDGDGVIEVFPPTQSGSLLYFLTAMDDGDLRLWESDGTEAGTRVRDSVGGAPFNGLARLGPPARFGDAIFTLVCREDFQELFRISPFPASATFVGSGGSCSPANGGEAVVSLGSRGVYLSGSPGESTGLHFVDPQQFDTQQLIDGLPPLDGKPEIVSLGSLALFPFGRGGTGYELWRTDSTNAGTALVKDIAPGFSSSRPRDLTPAGDVVYFAAQDPGHGEELWVTDGTTDGTRLVHDIFPGSQSSSPEQLTVVGDRLYFTADDGLTGRELWVLPLTGGPACRASEERLCLQGDRFRVEARWRNFRQEEGPGRAVALTPDTGYFWFFNDENVETVLKVLDGRVRNEHFWTFYGALSNVEYWHTVTDTETGLTRRYYNPPRGFASVGDTFSFGPQGASFLTSPDPVEAGPSTLPEVVRSQAAPGTAGSCAPSSERLCLNGGRFAVEVAWADFNGGSGTGKAVDLTDDTGYFWFFRDTNVELIVKVLDGTFNNGHFWVFYGSLSNVDFDVTVTDTETGEVRTYLNRGRGLASMGDTRAFEVP